MKFTVYCLDKKEDFIYQVTYEVEAESKEMARESFRTQFPNEQILAIYSAEQMKSMGHTLTVKS